MSGRERPPVAAHLNYEAQRDQFQGLELSAKFEKIFETNLWGEAESRSGPGSALAATANLRAFLEALAQEIGIRSMLDVPCGDFAWMQHTNLAGVDYVGGDIVAAIAERNQQQFGGSSRRFLHLDLTRDPLPPTDLVFCRDCLVHLSLPNVHRALDNIRRSGATWFLSTTFPETEINLDIEDGDWRPLNLEREPFPLGTAGRLFNEGCTESGGGYSDKSLGLWRLRRS